MTLNRKTKIRDAIPERVQVLWGRRNQVLCFCAFKKGEQELQDQWRKTKNYIGMQSYVDAGFWHLDNYAGRKKLTRREFIEVKETTATRNPDGTIKLNNTELVEEADE